ncbi:hypothetical protein SAMN04487948_1288 [Halogranum amylolyticum]|uniref:Uncharacterized protein n=1 Tax=Halogranum amylolyticum TaxID=660520 RepID=A0A1H8WDV8_9EURY|nr:hypothetical protein [Halogranum amylolyticum]SEP25835.1 hypothetical protein SAMN04487948_1288 [Halogranum amylolyticum]
MHGSRPRSRRRLATAITVVVLLALLVVSPGLVAPHAAEEVPRKGPDDVKLVTVSEESDARLWPFTSRQRSFESLTLPINAVVRAENSRVVSQLRRSGSDWELADDEWQGVGDEAEPVVVEGTDVTWDETTGATRYTYVAAPGSAGGWTAETAQLHDGTYFGSRYHLRLYEGGTGGDRWTAIQAHHEHWDWFRLRHTVGSLSVAQQQFETEYFGAAYTADVGRERFANGGISDADGWVSTVDLRPLSVTELRPLSAASVLSVGLLLFGSVVGRASATWRSMVDHVTTVLSDETGQRSALLFAALLSLPLFVRSAAVFAETAVGVLPVKLVAGTLYLVLAVGVPAVALALPREGEPFDWAGIAILGLGVGFVLDYQSIGIDVLPIAVVLHRLTVLAAVGFLAAGASRPTAETTWNSSAKIGLVTWLCLLAWPLFVGL